jgi:putative ABC transport system ATP-binding protein
MIEVRNVTRTYGKKSSTFQALRGVSFRIPTGATVAIIGKSGSGKSTLMHLMGGLDRPTSGEVIVNDKPLGELSRRAMDKFRAQDLGFVFQSFFIEGNQTCYQNVALPLEINEVSRRKRKQLAEKALEQVELFDKVKAKAKTLSGGQKQRLAIARAIVNSPKVLMADEPTGNLDSATGEKVIDLLFDLNRRLQCTLVIITHDIELADRCQYQIELKDGIVVGLRKPHAKPAGANGVTPNTSGSSFGSSFGQRPANMGMPKRQTAPLTPVVTMLKPSDAKPAKPPLAALTPLTPRNAHPSAVHPGSPGNSGNSSNQQHPRRKVI